MSRPECRRTDVHPISECARYQPIADCGCDELHEHALGCSRNHYPHDACETPLSEAARIELRAAPRGSRAASRPAYRTGR